MLLRILIVIFIACPFAWGEELSYGMSEEEVSIELGRPDSTMSLGGKEVWIYADGSRIEFVDGTLRKENGTTLTPPKNKSQKTDRTDDPLIKAEDIVVQREDKTISASIQSEEIDLSKLADNSMMSESLKNIEKALSPGAQSDFLGHDRSPGSRIQKIAITFGIELVVTLIVLSIAFQISGFPIIFRQILLLSMAVAMVGVIIDLLLSSNPLNPIRTAAGLIVLLLLIRQLTDVREWATAIKIALVARIISFAMIWLLILGLSTLFHL